MGFCRVVLCSLVVLHVSVGYADRDKAAAAFKRGNAEFQLEHWDLAIAAFEDGFREEPKAAFLFNIAQSHARAGRPDVAIRFYKRFVDYPGVPDEDRQTAVARVAELEAQIAAHPVPPIARVELTAPPPAPPPHKKRWPIAVGVVAGVLVIGVVVAVAVVETRPKEATLPFENAR